MRKWKQVVSKYGISKMQLREMCDVFGLWQNWAFWLRLFQHIPCHQHTLSHQHILCHHTSFAITHLLPPTHTRQYGAHCCSEISQEGIFVCALED